MTNILDQVARTSLAALRTQFLPETPSQFLALRLAVRMNDSAAVRHYVGLAERFGDQRLLTAYCRVREAGHHTDLGRAFLGELERLAQRNTGTIDIETRRLAAIRIERRAVAVAILSGEGLDSPPQVRQLSSDVDKAINSAVAFITRLLERRPFNVAAMEVMPDREKCSGPCWTKPSPGYWPKAATASASGEWRNRKSSRHLAIHHCDSAIRCARPSKECFRTSMAASAVRSLRMPWPSAFTARLSISSIVNPPCP